MFSLYIIYSERSIIFPANEQRVYHPSCYGIHLPHPSLVRKITLPQIWKPGELQGSLSSSSRALTCSNKHSKPQSLQTMWDSTDRTHNTPQIMTLKSNLLKYMFLLSAYQSGKIRANDAFVLRHFHLGMKNSQPYQILKASFRHFTHPNTKSKIQVSEPECAAVA